MATIHQFDPTSSMPRIKDTGGGGEPPMELLERIVKIESTLPTLATREQMLATREHVTQEIGALRAEMHKEIGGLRAEFHKSASEQTWKFITWTTGAFVTIGSALVAAAFLIAKQV